MGDKRAPFNYTISPFLKSPESNQSFYKEDHSCNHVEEWSNKRNQWQTIDYFYWDMHPISVRQEGAHNNQESKKRNSHNSGGANTPED